MYVVCCMQCARSSTPGLRTAPSEAIGVYLGPTELTLREKRRLRVFENRVLRRVFGSKRGRGDREVEKITLWGA